MLCSNLQARGRPQITPGAKLYIGKRNSHLCCLYRLLVREGGINITR
ncbi:hypothetical protein Q0F98_10535 [Paenibacillus amylolyticus]|nr:hypothetical protein Q0F98_10535 [Paenibacillus amylolyticus]